MKIIIIVTIIVFIFYPVLTSKIYGDHFNHNISDTKKKKNTLQLLLSIKLIDNSKRKVFNVR